MAELEAKDYTIQRKAKETLVDQCRRSYRSQGFHYGGRMFSSVPGPTTVEELRHWHATGIPVPWYKVLL